MKQCDIPAGRVNGLEDLFSEPHLAAVSLFEEFHHPSEGDLLRARSPIPGDDHGETSQIGRRRISGEVLP